MIPFVEVSHLPSSSSFYSAILQTLGLRCIYPRPREDRSSLQSSVAYGVDREDIILEVRQSENPLKPPGLSSLLISVPRRSAVFAAHSCWLKTEPPSWSLFRDHRGLEQFYNDRERANKGPWVNNEAGVTVTRAVIYDHDGNRLEVCHDPISAQEQTSKLGWTRPHVLEWNHDFEASPQSTPQLTHRPILREPFAMAPAQYGATHSGSHRSSHGAFPSPAPPPVQVTASRQAQEPASPRQSSRMGGLNTTTVVGALLGAAAGAALTYGLVSNPKEVAQSHEREHQRPTQLPRRATFPEKPVTGYDFLARTRNGKGPIHDYPIPREIAQPSFQPLPIRGSYVDGDEDVKYDVDPFPPPRYLTQGSATQDPTRTRASSISRTADGADETRKRHGSRISVGRAPSARARSEIPHERVPLALPDDWDHRNVTHTRRNAGPESVVSRPPLSRSHRSNHDPDHDSYVSARSHRSYVTARQPEREHQPSEYETAPRGRRSSYVSVPTMRERSRDQTKKAPSHVSARRVPLPGSVLGSSHVNWDPWDVPLPRSGVGSSHAMWDDDLESLAPSDSISCAGSKGGRQSHNRRH